MSEYVVLSDRPGINADIGPLGTLSTPILDKGFNVTTASLTQPIWTGGRVKWAVNAAASEVSAAERSEVTTVQDVKLAAVTAYVTVLRARRLLAVAQSNVVSLQAHVKDVSNMLKQGMVAKNDYLSVQVALANAVQARRRAINGLDTARASYNRQVGRRLDVEVVLEEIDLPRCSGDLAVLTQHAVQLRSELATFDGESQRIAKSGKAGPSREHADGRLWRDVWASSKTRTFNRTTTVVAHCGLNWSPYDGGIAKSKSEFPVRESGVAHSGTRRREDEGRFAGSQGMAG